MGSRCEDVKQWGSGRSPTGKSKGRGLQRIANHSSKLATTYFSTLACMLARTTTCALARTITCTLQAAYKVYLYVLKSALATHLFWLVPFVVRSNLLPTS